MLEKYGVPADRYAEFAILRGDPSDELPGVRGVGEKTARALIETYGSLDELLEDALARTEARPAPAASRRSGRGSARTPTTSARCSGSCRQHDGARRPLAGRARRRPLDELAEELAVKGPLQRLRAALASVAA